MNNRKVGQDMVIKKKASHHTGSLSRSSVSVQKSVPIVKPEPLQKHQSQIKAVTKKQSVHPKTEDDFFSEAFTPRHPAQNTPARGGILWILSAAAFVVLIFTIISLFAKATITVSLRETNQPVDVSAILHTEPSEGQIAFKTAKIVDKQSVIIPTANKQPITASASGTVKLFSTSPKAISIPAGTQLVSTAKKVFTTKNKVSIPAGSVNKPGSAEVIVTATVPGADSNIKLDDLKLPAFPAIIARTTTEITGGASGDQFILTEPELVAAKAKLESVIQATKPAAFLANQIPKNFILPESLIHISDISYQTESVDTGVSVTAERTITGNMIDRNDFQEFLINQLPESDRGFMKVFSDANITFLADNNSTINDSTLLPIRIKGSFKARAEFDEVAIRASLARQKKTDAKTLLKNIPGVISAEINLFPPWARRLPEKISAFVFKTTYQ